MKNTSGQIDNLYTEEEILYFLKYLPSLPNPTTILGENQFRGISKDHIMFTWFKTKIFKKIQEQFGDHVELLFGTYLNEVIPWQVHSDYYHKTIGEPYKAFLIPLSVDNDIKLANRSNTIIFNEEDLYVDPNPEIKRKDPEIKWRARESEKENSAVSYHDEHLSHISHDDLKKLTVQNILKWNFGSLLYWDEKLLHSSDNFLNNNFKSKQAIVIHTYVV
jgi:hypothetical protein